jgi:signal transduction histidine kinase
VPQKRRVKDVAKGASLRERSAALNAMFGRLGPLPSTAILTFAATCAALIAHIIVRRLEFAPITMMGQVNVVLVAIVVAVPFIFYSRKVIAELGRSRTEQGEMAQCLAEAVERSEGANRAKSAFLANMSHELRTPLNAIMGFSEIMKDQHLGPVHNARYLGYAGDIHASGRYLLGIINDILDLSKIEAGKMSTENAEEFALCDTIQGSLAMLETLAEQFDVELIRELPAADLRLVAVERMVRQILINLVGNAIKFTPAGGRVHVTCTDLGDACRIIVRDTGVGMGTEDIVHALTPFGQVANKLAGKHTGTGLGLPLAKAMMELHGGTLSIESRPSQGTRVTLEFPAERRASAKRAAA